MGEGLPEDIAELLGGSPDDYRPRIPSQRKPELYPGWERFDWTGA